LAGLEIERRPSVSDDQQKDHTDEPKDDVEGHKWARPEMADQNEEPDVEGHVFEKADMKEFKEMTD
jgi:hypothetical protein